MIFRELLELQQAYLKNEELEKTQEYKEFSRVLISDEMLAWQDGFRTYGWEEALPAPEVAKKQIGELLSLV